MLRQQANDPTNPAQFIITTFHPQIVMVADNIYGVSHSNKISKWVPRAGFGLCSQCGGWVGGRTCRDGSCCPRICSIKAFVICVLEAILKAVIWKACAYGVQAQSWGPHGSGRAWQCTYYGLVRSILGGSTAAR